MPAAAAGDRRESGGMSRCRAALALPIYTTPAGMCSQAGALHEIKRNQMKSSEIK
jgi:hypothetical protein